MIFREENHIISCLTLALLERVSYYYLLPSLEGVHRILRFIFYHRLGQ